MKSCDILPSLGSFLKKYADIKEIGNWDNFFMERPIRILIMGEYSSGKSTFINALLGENYADVKEIPTTAVPTIFKYGTEEKLVINYDDGMVEESVDSFSRFTVKDRGRRKDNNIQFVTRRLKHPFLQKFTLIDTPGLNDIDEVIRSEATLTSLSGKADITLWISKGSIGKDSEKRMLRDLLRYRGIRPQAVINGIDLIDDEEDDIDEIIQEFKFRFDGYIDNVFPLSAKEAYEGRPDVFFKNFIHYLEGIESNNKTLPHVYESDDILCKLFTFVIHNDTIFEKYDRETVLSYCEDFISIKADKRNDYYSTLLKAMQQCLRKKYFSEQYKEKVNNKDKGKYWAVDVVNLLSVAMPKFVTFGDVDNLTYLPENKYEQVKTEALNLINEYFLVAKNESKIESDLVTILLEVMFTTCIAYENSNFSIYKDCIEWGDLLYKKVEDPYWFILRGDLFSKADSDLYSFSEATKSYSKYLYQEKSSEDKLLALGNLGRLYFDADLHSTAIEYFKEYLEIEDNIRVKSLLAISYYLKSEDSADIKHAEKLLEECYLQMLHSSLDVNTKIDILFFRVRVAEQLGNSEQLVDRYLDTLCFGELDDDMLWEAVDYFKYNRLFCYSELQESSSYEDVILALGEYFLDIDEAMAFRLYQNSCTPIGKYHTGRMCIRGIGTNIDYKRGFALLNEIKEELKEGCVFNDLAYLYELGLGVEKNVSEAFSLYKKASKLNNVFGHYNLARCYQQGIGCAVNFKKAFEHMMKAYEDGWTTAARWLADYYFQGIGCNPDIRLCLDYLIEYGKDNESKAIEIGEQYAFILHNTDESDARLYYLRAQDYHFGCSVESDFNQAKIFYEKAASMGYELAIKALVESYNTPTGIPVSYSDVLNYDKYINHNEMPLVGEVRSLAAEIFNSMMEKAGIINSISIFVAACITNLLIMLKTDWVMTIQSSMLTLNIPIAIILVIDILIMVGLIKVITAIFVRGKSDNFFIGIAISLIFNFIYVYFRYDTIPILMVDMSLFDLCLLLFIPIAYYVYMLQKNSCMGRRFL